MQIEPSLPEELSCSLSTGHSSRGVDQFQSSFFTVVDTTADNLENKTNGTNENFSRKSMAHSAEVRSKGNWKLEKQLGVDIIDVRLELLGEKKSSIQHVAVGNRSSFAPRILNICTRETGEAPRQVDIYLPRSRHSKVDMTCTYAQHCRRRPLIFPNTFSPTMT